MQKVTCAWYFINHKLHEIYEMQDASCKLQKCVVCLYTWYVVQVGHRYRYTGTAVLKLKLLYTGTGPPLRRTFHSVFFDNVCVVWLHCCISSQHFPLRITSRTWSTPSLMDPTVPITYKPAPAFNAIVSAIGPVALSPPLNTFVKMPAFVLGGQGSSTNQQQVKRQER
jgi:hypothetical protein